MEEALIRHLESFLLELGSDFAFIGRQRRLRVGAAWYRIDLLFYHRRLKCLVIIDLKTGDDVLCTRAKIARMMRFAENDGTFGRTELLVVGCRLSGEMRLRRAPFGLSSVEDRRGAKRHKAHAEYCLLTWIYPLFLQFVDPRCPRLESAPVCLQMR
jgi:hypothetical protein